MVAGGLVQTLLLKPYVADPTLENRLLTDDRVFSISVDLAE